MANNTPGRSFNTVKNSNRDQRQKRHKQERVVLLSIVAVAILIVLLALALLIGSVAQAIGDQLAQNKENASGVLSEDQINYTRQTQASSDIHNGSLILVSEKENLAYQFPDKTDLVLIEDLRKDQNGTHPYQTRLLRTDEKLQSDAGKAANQMLTDFYLHFEDSSLIFADAYRTKEDQSKLSTPVGYSEHHTGYVFTLRTYNSAGKAVPLSQNSAADWIYENCYKYGIICRYPDDKADVTGVDGYEYCFRYVGIAHATYMYENDLCLEEYLELLRTSYASDTHLQIKDASGSLLYTVFYVPAAETELTTLSIPSNFNYTVSGDNIGGFIVTVDLTQPRV